MSWQDDTFLGVQAHLHPPLLGSQQSFGHLGHRRPLGVRSVQEAAGARLLHHLSPQVAAHLAEGIVAEDDGAVLHLRVGDDELSIFWEGETRGMREGASGGGRRSDTIKRGSSRRVFGSRNRLKANKCCDTDIRLSLDQSLSDIFPSIVTNRVKYDINSKHFYCLLLSLNSYKEEAKTL